jgi:Mn2+/Fe2+ NRAMP family transporter
VSTAAWSFIAGALFGAVVMPLALYVGALVVGKVLAWAHQRGASRDDCPA